MMKKTIRKTLLLALGAFAFLPATVVAAETINNQVVKQKEIDDGGSGFYRSIVVSEKTLQHFTVYRPRNVKYAARREGPLPILIWFNGGCSGTNTGYEHMLNHIASHGYVVVAIGAFRMQDSDGGDDGSDWQQFSQAVDWLVQQEKKKTSDYYKAINVNNIAVSGHSCGGAQAIANCANSRVTTLLIMNSGMGGMSMGGASPETLNSLHCPIIYMTGGTDDVAYWNAKSDFERVSKPAVWADLSNAGHYGSTYWVQYGGEYGKIALKWMDWHMKGYKQNARVFLKPDLTGLSTYWTIQNRNFSSLDKDYDAAFEEKETYTGQVFDPAAIAETFDFGADICSLTLETNNNKVYYNKEGKKKTLVPILKEQGLNSVRVRVLVNPSSNNYNKDYARSLITTARAQSMNIMLDLHFCDWWGDYVKPLAWDAHDVDELIADVTQHTAAVMKSFGRMGNLKWVQIGNEIDEGLLWADGKEMTNFVLFNNAAYDAVKAARPEVQTILHVGECVKTATLTKYFDALQEAGAKWDAIGLSVHVKGSTLKPETLTTRVAENVKLLKERYGKPVLIVETGYYIDRPVEANQWLCSFLHKLIEAGASGLYYWEPELTDDFNFGAFNPRTRKPSLVLDAFLGIRHTDDPKDAIQQIPTGTQADRTEYYAPNGIRLNRPQHGLNIVRKYSGSKVESYKILK